MTNKGHSFGRLHDPRFTLHQQQPRADKLGIQQRQLCTADAAYTEALCQRVSDPARWEAFLNSKPDYTGQQCPRCSSTRRRTRDRSCYACKLKANAENFERILLKVAPVAARSRAGYLDMLHRKRRERAGDCATFSVGRFSAWQYPTGRLAVQALDVHIDTTDLNKLPGPTIVSLCHRFPELRAVLGWAGWSVPD
jgi:hypothetical protein